MERIAMTDHDLMLEAIRLAGLSSDEEEVPVGAVIARGGEIIGCGRNRREKGKNALLHAEIEAIDAACKKLGGWRLPGCALFVTLEPCPMCAGAVINSRIERVVFGACDPKAGSFGSLINLAALPYNHRPEITGCFMENECAALLSDFFAKLRKK